MPDAAIARHIQCADVDVQFASYATGFQTLAELGFSVSDLALGEDVPMWPSVTAVANFLRQISPTLVVSHEEFCVPPIARAFGLRCIFLTDWFSDPKSLQMQALKMADEILFLDNPGLYDEPTYLRGKTRYFGPVLRDLNAARWTRESSRVHFDIPQATTTILYVPGGAGYYSEARTPMIGMLGAAVRMLDLKDVLLVIVASPSEHPLLVDGLADLPKTQVLLLPPQAEFTGLIKASDLVITKGNRLPLLECEVLGVRTLSLSLGLNPIDDLRLGQIRTNTALRARACDPEILARTIRRCLTAGESGGESLEEVAGRPALVAKAILANLQVQTQGGTDENTPTLAY